MYNPDGEKIECALGNKEFFLAGQESQELFLLSFKTEKKNQNKNALII